MVTPPSDDEKNPFGEPTTRRRLFEIERASDFWNRKPQLQFIYHAAQRENVSPWGLLAVCMAHRLSHIPPNVVLVKPSGDEGATLAAGTSLNAFVGLVAPPGRGKSVTFRLATELIPPKGMPLPDGTGQGIVKAFGERAKISKDDEGKPLDVPYVVTRYHTHALVLHAPEVTTLNAEFVREGSKTAGMMRSLWVGETVGMTNAERERAGAINSNMARLCGIWGVQPQNAVAIMDQVADGTPQRFLWVPARDRRFRHHPELLTNVGHPPQNTSFPFPVFGNTPPGIAMGTTLPMELRDDDPLPEAIWVHRTADMDAAVKAADDAYEAALGDYEEYDEVPSDVADKLNAAVMQSHAVLMRIKLAAKLGFLWGNTEPDATDWELAGVLLELSTAEAAGVWSRCAAEAKKEAAARGTTRGVEQDAADVARNMAKAARVEDVASTVYTVLAREGGCTEKALARPLAATKRPYIRDALRHLEDNGKAEYDGARWYALYKGNKVTKDDKPARSEAPVKLDRAKFEAAEALEAAHRAGV
ncbi:hypothetical protein [Mycobacteroides abscessus]|uniref:hypothetical protein n=1 Tax=Mycobacteroides abscessus TaxID=36809 RepID=UPI000C267EF8|nr:hypothetical protein [Mycobacteroides abscessus]